MKIQGSENWRKGRKCILQNTINFVFLTKHKSALTQKQLTRLQIIFDETCSQMKCQLLNFSGSVGHVHFSVLVHTSVPVSSLVAKLKAKSAYFVTREFFSELKEKTFKNRFWSSSYCAVSDNKDSSKLVGKFIVENTEEN